MAPAVANPLLMGYKALYRTMLEDSKRGIARAVRVFAAAEAFPVLVHCIHGKDRTGLVIALLLMLCDVDSQVRCEQSCDPTSHYVWPVRARNWTLCRPAICGCQCSVGDRRLLVSGIAGGGPESADQHCLCQQGMLVLDAASARSCMHLSNAPSNAMTFFSCTFRPRQSLQPLAQHELA